MSSEILGILPDELRFTVEANKQSTCSIQLINKTDLHVAFKVKTTSPKKYCVRPNVGIIKPNGTCEFTVTMQVQRATSLDLQCKDKFLVQSTVVQSDTIEEDLTSDMFAKDSGRIIEERKLRVILVCAPQSAVLVPVNGNSNQDLTYDTYHKDKVLNGVENLPPFQKVPEDIKSGKPMEELGVPRVAEMLLIDSTQELAIAKSTDSRETNSVEETNFLKNEMEDMRKKELEEYKSKLEFMESKLAEAEQNVAKITAERSKAVQDKDMAKRELGLIKRRLGGKTVHIGFPLLYVCMVALICLTLGYVMQ